MFKRLMVSMLIVLFVATESEAARLWSDGASGIQTLGADSVVYRYYLPENYDASQSYPLVLYLHGALD